MSSKIVHKIHTKKLGYADMVHSEAYKHMQTLSEYVRSVMNEKRLSSYEIERRTHRQISQSYVNRIKNGGVLNPSPQKLKALAKGLGVSEAELFAVVRGIRTDKLSHERLAAIDFAYEGMPPAKKVKLDYLIEMLEREVARLKKENGEGEDG